MNLMQSVDRMPEHALRLISTQTITSPLIQSEQWIVGHLFRVMMQARGERLAFSAFLEGEFQARLHRHAQSVRTIDSSDVENLGHFSVCMSDSDLGKKMVEEEHLFLFLDAYRT